MSSASSSASVNLSSTRVKPQDSFSGVRFDSVRHGYFFRCLEWLNRLSKTLETQQQEDSPNSPGVDALGRGSQFTPPATQNESISAQPAAVDWQQILQLRHNVVSLVQQTLYACVEAYPEESQTIPAYIQGIGEKSQISDAEAIDLIQAVEQGSARQKTVKLRRGGVTYSGLVVGYRQEPEVVEEAKGSKAAVSHPPSVPERPPSDPEDPHHNSEADSQECEAESVQATETGEANAIVPHGKHMVAIKTQDSAVRTVGAAGLVAPGDATGTAQASLPPGQDPLEQKLERTAKRYSAVEHPAALVRALRERYQLSQEKFARKVDVASITVNRWENGHSMPRDIAIARLKKLTKKLDDRGEDLLEKHFPEEFEKLRKQQGLNSAKG